MNRMQPPADAVAAWRTNDTASARLLSATVCDRLDWRDEPPPPRHIVSLFGTDTDYDPVAPVTLLDSTFSCGVP